MSKRNILLRFDDLCPTMNWSQWNKAKELLDKKGVKALLGVIPDCKDEDLLIDPPRKDFWDYIISLQNEGFTIAMHGYQHIFDIRSKGLVTPRKHSEFAGHSYEEQFQRIKQGKDILKSYGIETDIFFAPAHSYDDNTLKALQANGFRYISDGLSRGLYERYGIICCPCRSTGIPKVKKQGFYTAVVHAHEWAKPDKAKGWIELESLIKNDNNIFVSFEDYKSREIRGLFVQRINELFYFIWMYWIKPFLSKIKSKIIR